MTMYNYESDNAILEEFTKEYIVEKRLFPYISFYIARYEKELTSENSAEAEHTIEKIVEDLAYFRDEMKCCHQAGELSDAEIVDLMGFVNTIITHITNGNKNEERLVNIMGGTIIETESEKLIRRGIRLGMRQGISQGRIQMIIELGREDGLDDAVILRRIQDKGGLSPEDAETFLQQYEEQNM